MNRFVRDSNMHERDGCTVDYRIAATRNERRQAFCLVYECYRNSGLIKPNPYHMRVLPHHLSSTTNVFVAFGRSSAIATVTLIGDGQFGLPLESIHPEVAAERRQAGLTIAEISCLAVSHLAFRRFFPSFIELTRLMAQYARYMGIDQLLAVVHPRHARIFERLMGFQPFGSVKPHPSVGNQPALACCLDFRRIDRSRPGLWDWYFASRIPNGQLRPQPMPSEDQEYFRSVATLSDGPHPAAFAQMLCQPPIFRASA